MIETGDISIIRDFVDVRDVVKAYYLLLKKGRSGKIYNICSGKGTALRDVIRMIADRLDVQITSRINPQLVRPNDNKVMIGTSYKIFDELGWVPDISLEQTISDMIKEYGK